MEQTTELKPGFHYKLSWRPELTARIDGPSTRLVETARPSTRWRVMETGHPSTRAVNSGSGNRALGYFLILPHRQSTHPYWQFPSPAQSNKPGRVYSAH